MNPIRRAEDMDEAHPALWSLAEESSDTEPNPQLHSLVIIGILFVESKMWSDSTEARAPQG